MVLVISGPINLNQAKPMIERWIANATDTFIAASILG